MTDPTLVGRSTPSNVEGQSLPTHGPQVATGVTGEHCISPAEVARVLETLEGAANGLARDLANLSKHWQEVMQTSGESAVGHLALYDSAAMDVEVNTSSSVQAGQQLLRGCLALHEELRGMDILAARVKYVKSTLEELETISRPILR